MTVSCDVILDAMEVNAWCEKYGHQQLHPMRKATPEPITEGVELIERNDVQVALLGRHGNGVANIVLVTDKSRLAVGGVPAHCRTIVPLALLEHICEAMRDIVGPDERLVSTGEAENPDR